METEAAAEPEAEEDDGFSFVQSFDALMSDPQPQAQEEEEIPEVELADIDEIFSSALAAPADPEPLEPEFDFVRPLEDLKDKFSAPPAPQTAADDAFSSRVQDILPDEPEEPTQIVSLGDAPQQKPEEPEQNEDKPEKKHRRFSLFSRYEDDDDEDDDEDDDDDDDEEDDEDDEGGFRGFFRK